MGAVMAMEFTFLKGLRLNILENLSHCGPDRPEVSLGYSKDQKSLILCEVIILTPVISQNERQRKKMATWDVQVLLGENAIEVRAGDDGDERVFAVVVPDVQQILPRFVINFK